jgi:hypothetical protein
MFIVLFPRVGTPHIFNYQLSNGQFRTICGKNMIKENTLTTIAGDSIFPGICDICSHKINDRYQDYLNDEPRLARNSWQGRIEHLRDTHYCEILGPAEFIYEMTTRNFNLLNKAKLAWNRNKKK